MPTMQCRTSGSARPPEGTGAWETERTLALRCDSNAPAAARDALRGFGRDWVLGDAMLVASELVSNAVVHSGAREQDLIHLTLRLTDDKLLIAVTDPGAAGGSAQPRPADDPFGGIGLRLVEEVSRRWGSDHIDGHHVWAELALPPTDA